MKVQRPLAAVSPLLLAVLFLLPACKGSSSDTTPQPAQPATQPTSAVVKLSTAGTLPAGKKIGTIDLVLTLAPGVTLKSTTNPPATDDGVVTASGVASNSLIVGNYTAPTSTLPGKVHIGVVSLGFTTGEFATVNGDITAGYNPKATEFSVIDFAVTDSETNPTSPISGLTAGIAVDIK